MSLCHIPASPEMTSSPIGLRAGGHRFNYGLEGALPPGLMMNSATARWTGHRWAFSGYIPEVAPPLVDDPEFELLPPPPCGDPVAKAKARRTQKKKPEVASRPSSDSVKVTSDWKRMSLRLLCFARRFGEALSGLTYVLRPRLRRLLDSAVNQVGQQRLLLHEDFGEAADTSSIAISLLALIGAKKSVSECHHYAATVRHSPPNIWYLDCPVCQGRWCRNRRSDQWRREETPFPPPLWQGLSIRWEDVMPPPDWMEAPELIDMNQVRDKFERLKASLPEMEVKMRRFAV